MQANESDAKELKAVMEKLYFAPWLTTMNYIPDVILSVLLGGAMYLTISAVQ